MSNIDSFVEAVAHHSKKKEFDQAAALLSKETLAKHPRAWASIIDAYKGDCARQTVLLAAVGGLRASQVATDDRAADQLVELFDVLVEKSIPSDLVAGGEPSLYGFRSITYAYTNAMQATNQHFRAVRQLKRASDLFRPAGKEDLLTAFHPCIARLHLAMQNPQAVARLINDEPVFEIDPATTGVKAVDFMSYFYYGGIAFAALRQYKSARECLRNVLCTPAQALSTCMLLAYKCLLLLNAITEPKRIVMPPNMEHRVERNLKLLAKPYAELTSALETRDDATVAAILQSKQAVFEQDDLMGLVQQAIDAAPRQAILSLTRVYMSLTINQMAQQVQLQPAQVERTLASMIARGELDAVIDSTSGTVSFGQGRVPDTADIQRDIDRAVAVNQRIRDIDDRVVTSKEHAMAKLRSAPNLRELLHDYDQKRKQNRGLAETLSDAVRGMGA